MRCKQCGEPLKGRQTAYCSKRCARKSAYARNPQAFKDRAKRNRVERMARDPEGFKVYNRERARRLYWSDQDKAHEVRRRRYARNPEAYRAYARNTYWKNPTPYRERALRRIRLDPEGHRASQRARYYADHTATLVRLATSRDRRRDKIRAYERENRERRLIYTQARRAQRRGNGGSYTLTQWRELCATYGHACLACGEVKRLTPDHIVPIALGGSSYISNIQPLCLTCNKRKGTRIIDYRSAPVTVDQLSMVAHV